MRRREARTNNPPAASSPADNSRLFDEFEPVAGIEPFDELDAFVEDLALAVTELVVAVTAVVVAVAAAVIILAAPGPTEEVTAKMR